MTVKELCKQLEEYHDDDLVVLASDGEWNDLRKLFRITEIFYDGHEATENEDDTTAIVLS